MTLKHTDSDLSAALAKGREEALAVVRSLEIKDGQDWFTRSQRELFDEIVRALSPSSPGESAARNVTEEDARMFDAALSNSVDVVHSGDPLPAPPREKTGETE